MILRLAALAGTAVVALSLLAVGAAEDDPPLPEGVLVQARGPVHEAFAEASDPVASPGPVVPTEPPEPIEELPPDERPEGDNIVWVPGYWGWDEEAEDFLWVSGLWRAVPPERTWVPGYWDRVRGGYVRVAGYWADEREADVTVYLSEPPETLERGPTAPAPSDDSTYVPGAWVFEDTRYLWRPGYWVRHRPGWVWVPDCYKWTPAGYVYVPGYWDVPLGSRGLLFAPVRFADRVHLRRDFVYRPAYIVQPDFLMGAMFVRRTTRTYYFGNYFDDAYRPRYVPWIDHTLVRGVYDGNFAYYRRTFADQPAWERGLRALYTARYRGDIRRPPTTLARQARLLSGLTRRDEVVSRTINITNVQNVTALAPIRRSSTVAITGLASLAGTRDTTAFKPQTIRVERASKEVVTQERRNIERFRAITRERQTVAEKAAARVAEGGRTPGPVRMKMDLPRAVAPARPLKGVKPPPPPARGKAEERPLPKGPARKDRDPSDRDRPPPRDKDRVVPKDRDKDRPPPPPKDRVVPKDRDKDRPPPRDKDRPPPPRPKDKDRPPPPPKDRVIPKDKDRPPVTPPRDTDRPPPRPKDRPPVTPPRPKDRVVPPKDKDRPPPPRPPRDTDRPPPPPKDRPPVTPPPRPKDKVVPPKDRDRPPPPPKDRPPVTPPRPKDRDRPAVPPRDRDTTLPPRDRDRATPPPPPPGGGVPPRDRDTTLPPRDRDRTTPPPPPRGGGVPPRDRDTVLPPPPPPPPVRPATPRPKDSSIPAPKDRPDPRDLRTPGPRDSSIPAPKGRPDPKDLRTPRPKDRPPPPPPPPPPPQKD